ncbi:MAG: helix-turn-helix domain-containing protein [Gemmatimonadales bacterium]|nr:helix-turn-helix domain-containing protein [Gemmatimonadales bacterium]
MQRRARPGRRSGCPISLALELFGDPWTLLIVRDVMFKARRTFREFQDAGEGMASNILADRLGRLEQAGILSSEPDPTDARRVLYGLTPKGADLAPVLVELVLWSARHGETDAPPAVVRAMRTQREQVIAEIRAQWRPRRRPRT